MSRTSSQFRRWTNAARQIADAFAPVVAKLSPARRRAASPSGGLSPEQLEGRQLMSTVTLTDGVLIIDGSGDARLTTVVKYDARRDQLKVSANGTAKQAFPRVQVQEIRVIGSPGSDRIHIKRNVDLPATINAGQGDDRIIGGSGDDTVDAGGGDDRVTTRAGDDTLRGGDGNDALAGGNGNDALSGDSGDDKILGGRGHDTMTGGSGFDRFNGGRGNDSFADRTTEEGGTLPVGSDNPGNAGSGNTNTDGGTDSSNTDGGNTGGTDSGTSGTDNSGGTDAGTGGDNTSGGGTTDGGTTDGGNTDGGTDGSGTGGSADNGGSTTGGGTDTGGTDSGTDNTGGSDSGGNTGGSTDSGNTGGGDSTDDSDDDDTDTDTTPDSETVDNSWGGTFDSGLTANAAPIATIRFATAQQGMAGHTVHAQALSSRLFNGDAIGAKFLWNFGDEGSEYNTLVGFNAAHTYDRPGTYTLTLTVTDAGGKSTTVTETITITPDTRQAIYVDAESGRDDNTGATPSQAVRSLARAVKLAGEATRIYLKRGQTHEVSDTLRINAKNVALDAYGDPTASATVKKVRGIGNSVFYISPTATGFLAQNLVLDSAFDLNSVYGDGKIPVEAFSVAGDGFTVRNCAFLNVNTGVQTEAEPTGVLVQDNFFSRNIRSYCIWSQGTDHVYVGNRMTDSRQEHLIRADGTNGRGIQRVLIYDNDLSRPSNRKGSIEIRTGQWFYIAGNRIKGGTLRVGLQDVNKQTFPDWAAWKCENGVIENNRIERVFINIRPGMKHLAVRNNVLRIDDTWAMQVECIEPGYDQVRKTEDVRFERNTVINLGATGSFLRLNGKATGLTLKSNLYVAPNLKLTGGAQAFAVQVIGRDLSSFSRIDGNVWPALAPTKQQDGLNYVGPADVKASGFRSEAEWDDLAQVGDDAYHTLPATIESYQFRDARLAAGSTLQKAA